MFVHTATANNFPPRVRVSQRFQHLLDHAQGRDLTVYDLEKFLLSEGFVVFVLLLGLPFVLPVPLPVSTPFGLAIILISSSIALGREPWLPRFIRDRRIKYSVLERILRSVVKIMKFLEKFTRPRLNFMANRIVIRLVAWGIAYGGLMLCLPLPIPGTNSLPALSIVFFSAGLVEKDGVFVLVGSLFTILATAYLAFSLIMGKNAIEWVWNAIF